MSSRGLRYPRSELAILRDLVRAQGKLIAAYARGFDVSDLYLDRRTRRLDEELEERQSIDQHARMCKGPKAAVE